MTVWRLGYVGRGFSPAGMARQTMAAAAFTAIACLAGASAQPRSGLHVFEIVNDGEARGELALTLELPRGLPGDVLQLRDDEGAVVPLQVTVDRRASFLLSGLGAQERRRLTLEPALDRRPRAIVEAARRPDRVDVTIEERPVVVYRGDESLGPPPAGAVAARLRRGGYLHPVLSPQGRLVTDDYPPNHLHHHGIWSAWAESTFAGRHPDFWNMGEGRGSVQFESLIDTWSGPVHGGVRARHRFVDLGTAPPTTALTEEWEVTVYALGRGRPAFRLFDLVSRQDTATRSAVEIAKYLYGPLGVRGNRAWNGAAATQFLTSEGRTRVDGHGTRARWCYMGGLVNGRPAGVAVFDHPQNVRHPQPMRLHPTEPFFSYAPVQLGPLTIEPGRASLARYRFVVTDGPPDAALFERLWRDFAVPPGITRVQ
jgi:hypothetical protein